jgi:RHS repeat-associated protein
VDSSEILEENNYYPFGLQHKGYNNVINGTENNYQTYSGKELNQELGLDWIDFGWRNYDPAIARWNVVDPLAEQYYSVTPFAYVANSPMILSDPDGREISFSITRDENGDISGITINVTGKIINNSSRKLNQKQLERRRDRILKGLSDIKIEGNGVAVNFTGNIEVANSEADIDKTDHVYRLVDDIAKVPGANHSNPNTNPEGFAPLGQNVIYLENDFTSRTAAHETGHSAGLKHIDDSSLRDFVPYAVDYFRGVARSPQHTTAEQVSAENYVYKTSNTRYSGDDFPKNLMHQSATRNSKGNAVAGNKVTRGQVRSIMYKIENGQINKGKQK